MKQRKFFIGDQWLYLKIYSGPQMLEEILLADISPIVNELYARNKILKFFFIRFFDDGHHLRLRFLLNGNENTQLVLNTVNERLSFAVENRIVGKICTDTYNQELERYGANTIEDIETLFSLNSSMMINKLPGFSDENDRWSWGMHSIYKFLMAFGLSDDYLCQLFDNHQIDMSSEFGNSKHMKIFLDRLFREQRPRIEEEFNKDYQDPFTLKEKKLLQQSIDKLVELSSSGLLEVPFDAVMRSIVHMHFNRLFKTQSREQEFVISYFMSKHLKSKLARIRLVTS